VDAIATYERALVTPNSAFDRFLGGEAQALSPAAREGLELFERLGCVSCHQGRNLGGNMFQRFGVMGDYFADRGGVTEADFGRYNVTGREEDRYRFWSEPPQRRGDGTVFTTAAARPRDGRRGDAAINSAGQCVEQVDKLVAFLESLSGEIGPALL
jgi:cytochrome c peroxidase